jgi:hypothetical protein
MTGDDRLPGERSLDVSDETSQIPPQQGGLQDGGQVAQFTLDYLDVLNGSRDVLPSLDDLSADLRQRVLEAWSSVDRLITDEPLPPLSADPIAIALGAVPTTPVDPAAMSRARKAQNLRPSEIAGSLQQRGWPTSTADVFAWERRPERLAPALLADVAATLGVSSDVLTGPESDTATADAGSSTTDDAMSTFLQVLYSDDLSEVVGQWAHILGLDPATAREDLQRRLSTAAHRGARSLTTRQWKAILVVLLASERARRGQPNDPGASA